MTLEERLRQQENRGIRGFFKRLFGGKDEE